MAAKLTNLAVFETSGVDHPAHLHEGFIVMKQADPSKVEGIIADLTESGTMTEENVENVEPATDTVESVEIPDTPEAAVNTELDAALARIQELEAQLAAPVDEVEALVKAMPEPVAKQFEELRKQAAEATAELRKEREARADAEAIAKARETFKHLTMDVETVAPALRKLTQIDAHLAHVVEETLKAADAQNESAALFAQVGKSATVTGSAYDRLVSLAKAEVEGGTAATFEQAFSKAAEAHPELYADYRKGA